MYFNFFLVLFLCLIRFNSFIEDNYTDDKACTMEYVDSKGREIRFFLFFARILRMVYTDIFRLMFLFKKLQVSRYEVLQASWVGDLSVLPGKGDCG